MLPLIERYCILHRQGFAPIFIDDRLDAVMLAETAVAAGAEIVEITCRRASVCDDIRRVKAALPELLVLAGSAVDDGPMLEFLRTRRPGVPTINQLCDLGVDGLVSAWPLCHATVSRLAKTHLLLPGVETVSESVQAVEAGAHFGKLFSLDRLGEHQRVALMTSSPLHGLLPIFVAGGVTRAKIESYVASRVALLGAGWGLILGERYQTMQDNPDPHELRSALRQFLETMWTARAKHQPELGGDTSARYLRTITHYHPFRVPSDGPGGAGAH